MNFSNKRPIYLSIIAREEDGMIKTETSYNFKDAILPELSSLNHELDVLKKEIINKIEKTPKEWEVDEVEDED